MRNRLMPHARSVLSTVALSLSLTNRWRLYIYVGRRHTAQAYVACGAHLPPPPGSSPPPISAVVFALSADGSRAIRLPSRGDNYNPLLATKQPRYAQRIPRYD